LDPEKAAAASFLAIGVQPMYQLTGPEQAALRCESKRLRKAADHNLFAAFSCEAFCKGPEEVRLANAHHHSSTPPQEPPVAGPSPSQQRFHEASARNELANGAVGVRPAANGPSVGASGLLPHRQWRLQDRLSPGKGGWRQRVAPDQDVGMAMGGISQVPKQTELAVPQALVETRSDPSLEHSERPRVQGRLWQLIQQHESKAPSANAEDSVAANAVHSVKSLAGVPAICPSVLHFVP
jgi:hypothetical protein